MATMLLNPADDFQFSCWHLSASLLFLWFLWHNILLILLWLIFLLHLCCFFGRIIDLYPCLITQLCLTLGLLCPWDFFRQEYWSELPFPSSRGSSWPRDQTCISCVSCISRWILYYCTIWICSQMFTVLSLGGKIMSYSSLHIFYFIFLLFGNKDVLWIKNKERKKTFRKYYMKYFSLERQEAEGASSQALRKPWVTVRHSWRAGWWRQASHPAP